MADIDKTTEINDIINKIKLLPDGDAKKGAMDAFIRILAGKKSTEDQPLEIPAEKIEIDPDLEEPEDDVKPDDTTEDTPEFDDPDHLLKPKEGGPKDSDFSDTPDLTDKDSLENKSTQEKDNGDKIDEKPSETKEGEIDTDDIEDDIDPAGIYDDPIERETKDVVKFEHKLKKGRIGSLIDQIEKQADTAEKKELIEKARELQEKLDPEMPSDEFDKKCGEIQSILDKVGKVEYIPPEEIESGYTTLEKVYSDPSIIGKLRHEVEDNRLRDPDYKKRLADKAEKERYDALVKQSRGTSLKSIAEFKKDLVHALKDQIDDCITDYEEETYAKENRQHSDDDIASPGIRYDEIPDENKPSIAVYFDQSGSWNEYDVVKGMRAIADLYALEKEYPDMLVINPPMYFSEILTTNREAAREAYRRECWDLIIQDIISPPKTKNVIIMTDHDIGYDYQSPGQRGCINGIGTTVDGCVWFLWKDGSRVPEAAAKLNGKKGTFQYIIK